METLSPRKLFSPKLSSFQTFCHSNEKLTNIRRRSKTTYVTRVNLHLNINVCMQAFA